MQASTTDPCPLALNYREFGQKLLELRDGLRQLSDIVQHAKQEARNLVAQASHGGALLNDIDPHFTARYDAASALEITGDYAATLAEVETLVEENRNVLLVTGTPGPTDWYMLHGTRARDLEARLRLHIQKLDALKAPLEM